MSFEKIKTYKDIIDKNKPGNFDLFLVLLEEYVDDKEKLANDPLFEFFFQQADEEKNKNYLEELKHVFDSIKSYNEEKKIKSQAKLSAEDTIKIMVYCMHAVKTGENFSGTNFLKEVGNDSKQIETKLNQQFAGLNKKILNNNNKEITTIEALVNHYKTQAAAKKSIIITPEAKKPEPTKEEKQKKLSELKNTLENKFAPKNDIDAECPYKFNIEKDIIKVIFQEFSSLSKDPKLSKQSEEKILCEVSHDGTVSSSESRTQAQYQEMLQIAMIANPNQSLNIDAPNEQELEKIKAAVNTLTSGKSLIKGFPKCNFSLNGTLASEATTTPEKLTPKL